MATAYRLDNPDTSFRQHARLPLRSIQWTLWRSSCLHFPLVFPEDSLIPPPPVGVVLLRTFSISLTETLLLLVSLGFKQWPRCHSSRQCPGDPLGPGSSPSLLDCEEALSFSGTLDHGERVWRAEISGKWRSDISRIQGTSALVRLLAFLDCHSKVWGVVKLYVWNVWLVFQLQEVAVFIPFYIQLYTNLLSLWTGVRLKVTLPC